MKRKTSKDTRLIRPTRRQAKLSISSGWKVECHECPFIEHGLIDCMGTLVSYTTQSPLSWEFFKKYELHVLCMLAANKLSIIGHV